MFALDSAQRQVVRESERSFLRQRASAGRGTFPAREKERAVTGTFLQTARFPKELFLPDSSEWLDSFFWTDYNEQG